MTTYDPARGLTRFALAAASLAVPVAAGAQNVPAAGFSRPAWEQQAEAEQALLSVPDVARMLEYHRALTSEPHHAGTPANERTAEYIAARLREFGFDSVRMVRYEVLLPRPVEREVSLVAPDRRRLQLAEPPFDEDPDTRKGGVLPPFNAYSSDGDVTGDVVYVNYGIPEDYAVLDSLGISVEGKIVIARYGRSWRGIKPRLAAERGAVGALIYSDPADDGYVQGDVMPVGKWRPEQGVQRGSVMDMPTYPGDPQTPFRPSTPGVERVPLAQVATLQKIPVQPISYGDALPILEALRGPLAPPSWRGGLPLTYHVGPGPARIRLNLRFDWSVRPIVNVIGVLLGSEDPDRIVMAGGHRDAWTFGGRDPISGATSLLETARALGQLAANGARPRRTIAIASWDAEEYGLIGSTEFGEEFGEALQGNLVVYLNRESYTAGPFSSSGVHSLQPLVNEVTRSVAMPGSDGTVHESWWEEAGPNGRIDGPVRSDVRMGALGSGSDYTVFLDHLGIPSLDMGFGSGNGIYHSRYDTHWFFTRYGDPGFEYGVRLAELVGVFLLRMANAEILPFDFAATAETIDRYLDEIEEVAGTMDGTGTLDLAGVRRSNGRMETAAATLNAERSRVLALDAETRHSGRSALASANQALLEAEAGFLRVEGLPGRPWYRHQVYAPGFYTGYGVKTLPGVREAVEKGDAVEAAAMARSLEAALERVRGRLVEAISALADIG